MSGEVQDERFAEMFVPGGQVEYEERATPALADFEAAPEVPLPDSEEVVA